MDVYTYADSGFGRIMRAVEFASLLGGSIMMIYGLVTSVIILAQTGEVSSAVVVAVFCLIPLIRGVYTDQPDIMMSDGGISVRVLWRWRTLRWKSIRIGPGNGMSMLISSQDLPLPYWLVGSRYWSGKRCFVIGDDTVSYTHLTLPTSDLV